MSDPQTPGASLAAALAKAQAAFTNPPRNRTVTIRTNKDREYSFKYADLAGVLDVVRKPLADNGLAILQPLVQREARVYVRTILLHESGEQLASELEAGNTNMDIKDLGGKITYIRRYALSAMLGIASEEDDDERPAAGAIRDDRRAVPDRPQPPKPQAAPWDNNPLYTLPYASQTQVYVKLGQYGKPLLAEVSVLSNDDLTRLEQAIPHRRKHFHDRKLPNMVASCDRDLKLVTGELTMRAADRSTPAEDNRGPKPDAKAGALFDAGETAPETAEPEPEQPAEPALVVSYAVNIGVDADPEVVRVTKALDTDELVLLQNVLPGEILAMALHPANADLFSPALGKALREHNAIDADPFTAPWLTGAWVKAHEQNKATRLTARKLMRLAILRLPLADRAGGALLRPEHRPLTMAERAKLLELVTSLMDQGEAVRRLAWLVATKEAGNE